MKPMTRHLFARLAPRWLTTGDGELNLYSLHLVVDAWLERARLGVYARFPEYAPADALAAIARDRKMIRGINEPQSSFAVRLNRWLDSHKLNGNPFVLCQQIRDFLQADIVVRTVDQNGNWFWIDADGSHHYQLSAGQWNWDSTTNTNWSRFWVIIYPGSIWVQQGEYSPFGLTYGPDELWGVDGVSYDAIVGLRSIIAQWKPAHAKCEQIIAAFDDSSFAPGTTLDGLWGSYAKTTTMPRTASRLSTARYISP